MAKINPKLLTAIMEKTGLSRAQAYARIQQAASAEYLPRHLAAIKVGAETGITINRFATSEELSQLRQAGSPVAPPNGTAATPSAASGVRASPSAKGTKKTQKKTANQAFVVHGRDGDARDAMFAFLRSLGIKPIEWNSAIAMSKKAAPYIGQVLDAGFGNARAIVVLLTPDDLARLRPELLSDSDAPFERRETGQARPNVLFEAGRAFSSHPDRTVMVQLGKVRPFSDIAGRHVVQMTDDAGKRQELATKLENAGCDVDRSGTDWLKAGDFSDPETRKPKTRRKKRK
ncbi:MAG: nucleotide-binding protein [Phycisphaerae bacterium]